MSEHIFQTDEIDGVFSVFVAPNIVVSDMIGQREEVVRCRDCKFSTSMGYQCEWFHGDYLTHAQVVPEGFCAWGEPREEE